MTTYIVRHVQEFTRYERTDTKEEWSETYDDVKHTYTDRTERITKIVREDIPYEMVVTSRAKAMGVAKEMLGDVKSEVRYRFEDDVKSNAGNPEEIHFEDQSDVPRLYTIYKALRGPSTLQDRYGFRVEKEDNPYFRSRLLEKHRIKRFTEPNPDFTPEEDMTPEEQDLYWDFGKERKRRFSQARSVLSNKFRGWDYEKHHCAEREVRFDFCVNEDYLLERKDMIDAAWIAYLSDETYELNKMEVTAKEGKTQKVRTSARYYIPTSQHLWRQEHPMWNDEGHSHYAWVEIIVVSPTKYGDINNYEYHTWMNDKEGQKEAREHAEREGDMRVSAAEAGHNYMVMNADGSYETWRE